VSSLSQAIVRGPSQSSVLASRHGRLPFRDQIRPFVTDVNRSSPAVTGWCAVSGQEPSLAERWRLPFQTSTVAVCRLENNNAQLCIAEHVKIFSECFGEGEDGIFWCLTFTDSRYAIHTGLYPIDRSWCHVHSEK
jgi:hypothetical protein